MKDTVTVARRVIFNALVGLEEIRQCAALAIPADGSRILDEACVLAVGLHHDLRALVGMTDEEARTIHVSLPTKGREVALTAALESLFRIIVSVGVRIQNDRGEWKLRNKREPVSDIIHDANAVLFTVGLRKDPPIPSPNWKPEHPDSAGGAAP